MSFFTELKRRNVFRVGFAYLVVSWFLLQIIDVVVPILILPDWVARFIFLLLAVGFIPVLIAAWAFELTPDGLKKEKDVDRSQSIVNQTGRKLDRTIIMVLVLALGYFAYDKFWGHGEGAKQGPGSISQETTQSNEVATSEKISLTPLPSSPDEKSVAVLPFLNMSDDAENEYFSDGISEELLNVLVRVPGLRVPSRTSSFTFKGSTLKLAEIGRELQVDHILEGSVRKSGDRIRVTAQLIEVNTDTHLWSETYTRQLDDIFAVQDEIAQAIVSALKVTLTGNEQAVIQSRTTSSVGAYNKYLLGRHLWNQRTPASLLACIEPLKEAIGMDPNYGRAWEALADAYVLIPEYRSGGIQEYIPLAHAAIDNALAINPDSAPALTSSAYIKFMYDYDFEGARADFTRAIEIDPGYATAHQWYGEFLATEGKLDNALDQLRLARIADPLAHIMPHDMGWFLMWTDRSDEAYQYFQASIELNPNFQNAYRNLAQLQMKEGHFDQARENVRKSLSMMQLDPATDLAVIDALENPVLKANAVAMVLADNQTPDGTMGKARMLMFLGEPELALDSLEDAFEQGDPYAVHMNRMDIYDPLRDNPRFQALLKKMNLWP
jgi:TolB-like protein/tetratricopeptide (TPR) repeat protein